MKLYDTKQLDPARLAELCKRTAARFDDVVPVVRDILDRVRKDGDKAVREYTAMLDKVQLDNCVVTPEEIREARARIAPDARKAFETAARNITTFHETQMTGRRSTQTMPGVTCFSEMRPIGKVGLYIPGGTAPLPSTVLMLAIPACLAGCKEVVMATPPGKDGKVPDIILFAADLCGVSRIYKAGGAQAIAALAYGTETVPKVDKIFGPGNQYVTAAKMLVSTDPDGAAIDMPAGPSEVLVIADGVARADFVAVDLLSQAEHGPDSQVVLVCTSKSKAEAVLNEVDAQLASLPRRDIAKKALGNSFALVVDSVAEAVDFANKFAPEHLIINAENADELVPAVMNAGSVFLGAYSCESAGDYASGTNHALPTYGYARAYSGVSVASFQKQVTFQKVTKDGARLIAPVVAAMAEEEGLIAHKRAMEVRV